MPCVLPELQIGFHFFASPKQPVRLEASYVVIRSTTTEGICWFSQLMTMLENTREVLDLLEKIQKAASDNKLASACYQLRAVLPDCNGSETLVELCSKLIHSPEHYQIAVSLIRFIVQDVCKKEYTDPLQEYVEAHKEYETAKLLPGLQLRVLLSYIAAALHSQEEIVALFNRFATLSLEENPDRFKASSDYCSMLKLFEKLELEGKFGTDGKNLSEVKEFLNQNGRQDIIRDHLDTFSPVRPYSLVVMAVELEAAVEPPTFSVSDYQNTLKDTYNVMPEIPIGQWPPIRKVHYINLALITSDPMPRNDPFSRATVRGSVDDLMSRKVPTTYEDVFPKYLTAKSRGRMLVLIEGRPACGKSTLLTKVSKDWAKGEILEDMNVVVLVRLRQFLGKQNISLEDIFGQYCANSRIVSSFIDEVTKTGGKGVCLLLDGLDEYGHLRDKSNFIRKLFDGHLLPNAAIIMASRPAGSTQIRNDLRLSKHVEIIGFLQKEIKAYIEHALSETPAKARALLNYLEKHPNISRMCYLPLHLAMVVFLYELGQELPDAETDLYYKFTLHTLYRSLLRESSSADDEDEEELHNLSQLPNDKKSVFESICLLAFRATKDQKQIFTGKDILEMEDMKLPVNYRKKAFDSLGLLTVDRIIADSSLPTKSFSFLHLTLQEFLSACHLQYYCNQDQQMEVIKSDMGAMDHMWVVWKFYCGLSQKVKSSPGFFNNAFHEISSRNISSDRRIASLNMVHCAFEAKSNDACVDLISQLEGRMDVNDISLTPSDCAAVGKVTSNAHDYVKEIDLSYCHLGPEGIGALVDQLDNTLDQVHLFRLRARIERAVGTEGAPALSKLLRRLPNLEELRLYGNKLKTVRFQYLSPIIRDMTRLQTLIVSRNDLDVDSGSHVSSILENLPNLQTFYISYNPICDRGLGEMKPGLLKCQCLKILGLRGTGLTEKSGVHLKDILSSLQNLELIELYQNRIGDDGVIDLLPGLSQAKSLETMSLVENGIGDRGAIALAKYLEVTETLKQMRVYYNHDMTDVGKIAIRSAVVKRPPHLTAKCDLRVAV